MNGNGFSIIEGQVVGPNELRSSGRIIKCWTNSMQSAIVPQPLDLSAYDGKVVEVKGRLHGDLWEASFEKVVSEDGYKEITGKVTGFNVITKWKITSIHCYRHGMAEARFLPLNLSQYMGKTVTVAGILRENELYKAQIIKVAEIKPGKYPEKEAKSLNDLLQIRAANREKIEKINGNLGTALGFKWTNNQKTDHPCIIIFVPQKVAPWLIPAEEIAPETLQVEDGTWCLTDVVTGGKAISLEDIEPLPELSEENKDVVQELRSGNIGLIGGIQIAFFEDGIEDSQHAFVGTAGIAVKHIDGKKGFLTNQHVADAVGRQIYHPRHNKYPIGQTHSVKEYVKDEKWYDGVIDETNTYVRCDCGFVEVEDSLSSHIETGLHAIGKTGNLLKIDPDTMDVIDQGVISVGRTRGVQRGTIVAYAYEFHDETASVYTDLLIIGEEDNAFSWKGDSGKIIVTDDEARQPVALLWGGWQERLRRGREQENWSYAIDLGKVLYRLELKLLT